MRLKCLKDVLAVLIIAGIAGCLVSCPDDVFNPFGTTLGAKVPVERPTITLLSPDTGSFLKGEVTIKAKAGAYRQLSDVKIKIDAKMKKEEDKIKDFESVKETMTFGTGELKGDIKNKDVSYTFDTEKMEDGILRVQFQVSDPDFTIDSVEYLYIVKNNPSTITLTNPDAKDLYTDDNSHLTGTPPEIIAGTRMLGNIVDRRGIKPGYPRIQIWKDDQPEPDRDDPAQWGVLFLSNIDDTEDWKPGMGSEKGATKRDLRYYTVENNVTFVFSLNEFELVDDPRDSTRKIIEYRLDGESKLIPLVPGNYRFRILTSDTFFTETKGDPEFMFPRKPGWRCPACNTLYETAGDCPKDKVATVPEEEITVYEPPPLNNQGQPYSVNYHTINVVPATKEITRIGLDNTDKTREELEKTPNIYMEKDISEKIIVSADERPAYDPDNPMKTFRLRVNAYHSSATVERAVLKWSHAEKGSGFLPLDNIGSLGYVDGTDDTTKAESGHKGIANPNGAGKIFQFTGINGKQYDYDDRDGVAQNGEIFTSSATVYKLTIDTYLPGTAESVSQDYYLLLDEGGPEVSIIDIKGKSKGATGYPDPIDKGGTINRNEYTVNDNIQVSQISSARNSIMTESGKQVIKYFVEVAADTDCTVLGHAVNAAHNHDYIERDNILLQKIKDYRSDPTSEESQKFMEFFRSEGTANTVGIKVAASNTDFGLARRGWVDLEGGSFKLAAYTLDANGARTATNNWNNKYLWLYVVAQDGMYNLGYAAQKLKVDDDGDKPVLELLNNLVDSTGGIANQNALYIGLDANGDPVRASANILGEGQNIYFSLSDDDGMRAAAFPGDRTIAIALSSLNFPGTMTTPVSINVSELFGNNAFTEWSESLTQGQMARPLADRLAQGMNTQQRNALLRAIYGVTPDDPVPTLSSLPDGVYTLEIDVYDALSQKVSGDGLPAPNQARTNKSIHFAVQSKTPTVTIDDIASSEGTNYITAGSRNITGMVTSRIKIQRLDITFSPDVITPANANRRESTVATITPAPNTLILYSDAARTTQVPAWNNGNNTYAPGTMTITGVADPVSTGVYTYYWQRNSVDFGKTGAGFTPTSDERRFEVQAWDGIGGYDAPKRTVQIDIIPPKVRNLVFNFGRKDYADNDQVTQTWNRVNGKVPIEVEIYEANGVGAFTATNLPNAAGNTAGTVAAGDPTIRWFLVPNATTFVPAWDSALPNANVKSGYFKADDRISGTRYRTVVDTTNGTGGQNLTGDYKLYVIAVDKAGNVSNDNNSGNDTDTEPDPDKNTNTPPAPVLTTFRVDQTTDTPRLKSMSPPNYTPGGLVVGGAGAELIIKGSIFDDDEYNPAKAGAYSASPAVNTAGQYVDILFPRTWNSDTGEPLTWNNSDWIEIASPVNNITKELDYTYDFSGSNKPAYLNSNGRKYYRLRIRDEADRSSGAPDAFGAYNPEGKNPDRYRGDGSDKGNPANNLPRLQIVMPGESSLTDAYSLFLKNTDPEIFFKHNDPTVGHPNYTATRPSFKSAAQLQAAMLGTSSGGVYSGGGTIEDISLNRTETYFTYGGIRSPLPLTPAAPTVPADGKTYNWVVPSGNVAAWLTTPFNSAGQGVQTITVEAKDTLNNLSSVEWTFYKDTAGPVITFDNISADAVRTISGIVRQFTTNGGGTNNTSSAGVGTGTTRYFTSAGHGLTVGDTVMVRVGNVDTKRYVLWVDGNNFKLSDDYTMANQANNVWNENPGNIAVTTVGTIITGRFEDAWTDIAPTFEYRIETKNAAGTWTGNWVSNLTNAVIEVNGNSANWSVLIDPTGTFDGSFPDGLHRFSIRAQDILYDGTPAGTPTNRTEITNIEFVVDRQRPNIPTKPAGTTTATQMVISSNMAGVTGYLAESQRVFSAANVKLPNGTLDPAAATNGNAVFTLRGVVYEHNLNTLRVEFRNGATRVGNGVSLFGIDRSAIAWKDGGTQTGWFYGKANEIKPAVGNDDDLTNTQNTLRVRRATTGEFGITTANFRYVWELDVRVRDFYDLVQAGNDDGIRRVIAVTARDLAGYNPEPETEAWPFFLDSNAPEIELSNLALALTDPPTTPAASVLADSGDIILKGMVVDSTPIQKIEYKIEKFDYATSAWEVNTNRTLYTITAANSGTNDAVQNATRYFTRANHGLTVGDTVRVGGTERYVLWVGSGTGGTDANSFKLSNDYTMASPATNVWDPAAAPITVTSDFKPYTPAGIGTASRLQLNITDTAAIPSDGYYRVTLNTSDWSIPDGNKAVIGPGPGFGPVYFHVDRKEPDLKWGTSVDPPANYGAAVQGYYSWVPDTPSGYKLEFDFTAIDDNTFTTPASGKLYLTSDPAKNAITNTSVAVSFANAHHATSKVNVTVSATAAANAPTLIQGRYTLELNITDRAGTTASANNTQTFYIDNTPPLITITNLGTANGTTNGATNAANNAVPGYSNAALAATDPTTGSVEFRGDFSKAADASPVKRVAFKIDSSITAATVPANPLDDTALAAAGWFYNNNGSGPFKLWVKIAGGTTQEPLGTIRNTAPTTTLTNWSALMEIDDNLAKAKLKLYNPRLFNNVKNIVPGTALLGNTQTAGAALTFGPLNIADDGVATYGNTDVNQLRIHLLAVDEAGNAGVKTFNYWIYPAGDYPKVTRITNPSDSDPEMLRQMNGTIKIQGTAEDNFRISNVWYRVLKDGASSTSDNGFIPAGYEPAVLRGTAGVALTGYGTGWYKSDTGGISKSVTWYAEINANSELEPTNSSIRRIIVQTVAEDTVWDDNLDGGSYTTAGNLLSLVPPLLPLKEVAAHVVSGVPTFANEQVKSVASSTNTVEWGDITRAAVKGTAASYQVTVRHNDAVGDIRWTNPPSASISAAANLLSVAKLGDVNANGIEVKAAPKLVTLTTIPAGTYMVWTWDNVLAGLGGAENTAPIPSGASDDPAHLRGMKFTIGGPASIGSTAKVLQQQSEGDTKWFEWLITVDLDTTKLGFNGTAGYYNVNFEAHDASKSVPLFSRKTAQIPVDNLPPRGVYTYTTNVVGTNPSFGGEAEDAESTPKGLSRVVLWFSRDTGTNQGQVSIVWNEHRPGLTNPQKVFNNTYTGNAIVGSEIGNWESASRTTQYPNVTLPLIPSDFLPDGTQQAAGRNNSCIVIDRQDPQGNQTHHGHYLDWIDSNGDGTVQTTEESRLSMGWAKTGGAMETSWYVSLNSTLIESGSVTAHFIVYDHAGNGTYYNQKLMILNGIPRIGSITLATDIYGQYSPLNLQTQFGANVKYGGNVTGTAGDGTLTVVQGNLDASTATVGSAIQTISNRYSTVGLANIPNIHAASDEEKAARGIRTIPINTSSPPGGYSVVFDEKDFMVRNNLLAIKVDTLVPTSTKNRYYRVEYVSRAREVSTIGTDANQIRNNTGTGIIAGRMYLIDSVGNNFPWGVLGAQGVTNAQGVTTYQRGLVFLALQNGSDLSLPGSASDYGTVSAWELNGSSTNGITSYYTASTNPVTALNRPGVPPNLAFDSGSDVKYNAAVGGGLTAEFVYRQTAFGTVTDSIRDFSANGGLNLDTQGRPLGYPASANQNLIDAHSLFIIKVFDGGTGNTSAAEAESQLFGDFALLAIRVNNNDVTPPYSQLYDLNPKTEGADVNRTEAQALNPDSIGGNRAKGGLWNTTGNASNVDKSGHIEPRAGTSLTSAQMGGAAGSGSINRPAANAAAYFTVDTVSGDVIVRGYAEDNQRIARVDLEFYNEANTTRQGSRVTILTRNKETTNGAFLQAPATPADRAALVSFTETVDLDRHRVEWSYLWKSETLPGANLVVGNINVRAVAYNAHTDIITAGNAADPVNDGRNITPDRNVHTSKLIARQNSAFARAAFDDFNPGFPASTGNFYRYNDTRVNLRPYITGFLRDQSSFSHNIRSRQGRYIFRRSEAVVVTGFNLRNNSDTTSLITLPGSTAITTSTPANGGNYGITVNQNRHRAFTVPAGAVTGNGLVTMTVNNQPAVNTGNERPQNSNRPTAIQPWNIEYNPGKEGSDLWDDFTMVHIWRSDDTNSGTDNSRFPVSDDKWVIENPAMSINPANGILYASHNEGGSGGAATGNGYYVNSGTSRLSDNTSIAQTNLSNVAQFRDPIIMSDVYRSPGGGTVDAATWTAFSVIGRSGNGTTWATSSGMYIHGPQGSAGGLNTGTNAYSPNDSWYDGESNFHNRDVTLNQFENPHIVTYVNNNLEHIHVSYYDSKDGSIKYRYNQRNSAGTINENSTRAWTNLDGGVDAEDLTAITASGAFPAVTGTGGRVVRYETSAAATATARGGINAGQHNAIAVTSQGYPVVAYFDMTNQRLKLAVSRNTAPVAAANWVIRDFVIPSGNLSAFGTGSYVSMKIDTRTGDNQNRVHIAALNSAKKQLVYITGLLYPARGTANTVHDNDTAAANNVLPTTVTVNSVAVQNVTVQVVDSVGDVGRWCSLSLDADGNPWISYQDEGYQDSKDGVKVAYKNTATFTKGRTTYAGQDMDINGGDINGWEAMHVPTYGTVQNARLGMENYPTRNFTGTRNPTTKFWKGAVSYLASDYYRIAYYVE